METTDTKKILDIEVNKIPEPTKDESSSEGSSSEDSDDEKIIAKEPAKKETTKEPAKKEVTKEPAKKKVTKEPAKKEIVAKEPAKKEVTKQPAKKEVAKKDESSSSEESSSEDSDDEKKKVTTKQPAKKEVAKKDESSSSEESSSEDEEESDDEKMKVAKKDESSSEESSSEDEEEKKPEKKQNPTNDENGKTNEEQKVGKRKATEIVDEGNKETFQKKLKQENGTHTNSDTDSSRIYVGNLSYSINDDSIREFFKDIGEIKEISWNIDKSTGKFYGSGFLSFENTQTAKNALSKNGLDLLGRSIRVEMQNSRPQTPRKRESGSFSNPLSAKPDGCTTVFLGNLAYEIQDNNIYEIFADCGEIKQIRWVTDKQTNEFKRCGFVEFASEDGPVKAVAHNGENLLGRSIRVDYSTSRTQGGNRY